MEIAPYFRVYELPWSPTEEIERRFRKVMRNAIIAFALIALIVPFLPAPEKTIAKAPNIPDRFVKMVFEARKPPPPPPEPEIVEEKVPEKVPEKPKPELSAREKAQKSMSKFQDALADLRDIQMPETNPQRDLMGAVGENVRSERNLITLGVGRGSGGINTAMNSSGFGSGSGPLGDITTGKVTSAVAKAQAESSVKRAAGSTKAARSEEEIVRIFDRNKGAIYAIYTRALRDKPDLKGKLVLEITISPEGSIVRCEVVSSELGDPELERKLVARVKLFQFEPRDVGTITVTKPIDFFPAA